jgi:hypothetical protein
MRIKRYGRDICPMHNMFPVFINSSMIVGPNRICYPMSGYAFKLMGSTKILSKCSDRP